MTEWNATAYHKVSGPQTSWGQKVLNRLTVRGDERAIDAGCGSGRLTGELMERLPEEVETVFLVGHPPAALRFARALCGQHNTSLRGPPGAAIRGGNAAHLAPPRRAGRLFRGLVAHTQERLRGQDVPGAQEDLCRGT